MPVFVIIWEFYNRIRGAIRRQRSSIERARSFLKRIRSIGRNILQPWGIWRQSAWQRENTMSPRRSLMRRRNR